MLIVSNVAVDLLIDSLIGIMRGVVINNIDVDVLVDVNLNVLAGVMTAFEFAMPDPLEEFRC